LLNWKNKEWDTLEDNKTKERTGTDEKQRWLNTKWRKRDIENKTENREDKKENEE
jgi:hypothetical protein